MDICYEDMGDGFVCMQTSDHLHRGVPHLRYGDGEAYWRIRHALETIADLSDNPRITRIARDALKTKDLL